jgi:hypothetical protein
MNNSTEKKTGWRQKIGHELVEYWLNFVYLFLFFGVFIEYRRLVLTEYKITYLHYGYALFKALILAKVIMIGDILRLARRLQDQPLILTTLYKTVVFTVFVAVFSALEHLVEGLLHGEGLAGGIHGLVSNIDEVLASGMVVFFAFIPFFAFRELGRVLGEGKIAELFLRKTRAATESEVSKNETELRTSGTPPWSGKLSSRRCQGTSVQGNEFENN